MTLQQVHSVITIIGKQVALIKILIISYSYNIMKIEMAIDLLLISYFVTIVSKEHVYNTCDYSFIRINCTRCFEKGLQHY